MSYVYAKEYPIQATMIRPQMQNAEYQVPQTEEISLDTLVCTNGKKVSIYNKKDIYIPEETGWGAKHFIRLSIVGDIVAKAIESDSVFFGGNTSLPIVVGTEVAKEGIIKYSEKHQVSTDKKQNALNITAGVSTGTSITNIAIAIGSSHPVGAFIGFIGGVIVYNQSTKQYEIDKKNLGKVKVSAFMDYPHHPGQVYACE